MKTRGETRGGGVTLLKHPQSTAETSYGLRQRRRDLKSRGK